jgi:hypothetical protein
MAQGRSKWERHAATMQSEAGQRAAWQAAGRPEVVWTGTAVGQDLRVIESNADGAGKRRKRRVRFLAWELTADQAQEFSDALATAAEHARTRRRS